MQEVDYAEMLEIPVSTVNVVRKKNKKKKAKDRAIEKVNERMNEGEEFGEEVAEDLFKEEENRFAASVIVENERKEQKPSLAKKIVIAEFAAACVITAAIFLTNVFLPSSAINTFMKSLFTSEESVTDSRKYSDFTLTSVVSERSSPTMSVSSTGVVSIQGEAGVYPVADGKIESVTSNSGVYTVVIAHSDSFKSITSGLSEVYGAAGDTVKANLPVGYSSGKNDVQIMLYEKDTLLSCLELNEENLLAWKK